MGTICRTCCNDGVGTFRTCKCLNWVNLESWSHGHGSAVSIQLWGHFKGTSYNYGNYEVTAACDYERSS